MASYSTIAPPPDREELRETEQAASATPGRGADAKSVAFPQQPTAEHKRELFAEALLETSPTRPGRRTWDLILSLVLHTIFLSVLVLVPLFFTEALDLKQFTQTMLVAPPPPPPPPPPASPAIVKVASAARRVFTASGKLLAPTVIPEKVAMLKEEALPPDVGPGVVGGVPGGVPGGQAGGVIGGIISGASRTYIPPAPTAPAPKAPLRVGGRVRAPRAILTPDPVYPSIAKQAKIQGDVVIDAVIDLTGHVVEMQVVSGHPMLIQAAMEALRKWRYEPTYLNEQPVAVQLLVTIKFRLN